MIRGIRSGYDRGEKEVKVSSKKVTHVQNTRKKTRLNESAGQLTPKRRKGSTPQKGR